MEVIALGFGEQTEATNAAESTYQWCHGAWDGAETSEACETWRNECASL